MWSVWECWYLTSLCCILGPRHFIKVINYWLHVIQTVILPGHEMDEKYPWKDVGDNFEVPHVTRFQSSFRESVILLPSSWQYEHILTIYLPSTSTINSLIRQMILTSSWGKEILRKKCIKYFPKYDLWKLVSWKLCVY